MSESSAEFLGKSSNGNIYQDRKAGNMSNLITIKSADLSVTLDLNHGGRLSSVLWQDLEVAVGQQTNPLYWGWYAMAPWAGRIRNAELVTPHGTEILPDTFLPPHAIHGLLLNSEISVGEHSESEALVWCDLPQPYEGGRVEQKVSLTDSVLTWTLTYINGERPMPVWLGFHPWFRRFLDRGQEVQINNPAAYMLELDDEDIPTGKFSQNVAPPWNDVFGGMRGNPSLVWPNALRIDCISDEPWWVIYSQDSEGVCMEPQTSPPDAVSLGLAPTLNPGETLSMQYVLKFSAL
jgi:aldose 1-epimerase